ncbi:glycosyltransferase family 4 protein [Oleispirillum naphthae]|uniref:glycosyltransferase family 4 protein n=1 Tax=Oleispirillum naphthae TaxID=2838853 RepID=UPI0030824F65
MLKDLLRPWKFRAACLPWRAAAACGLYHGEGAAVQFVIEKADWAIRWVGEHVRDEANALAPGSVATTVEPQRIAERVVHFGSQYMWLAWGPHMPRGNRYVTSFFHGKREDGPEISEHIDRFLESVPRLSKIVTGAGLVEERLLGWGVPREKLVRIPIGVDMRLFVPPSPERKAAARARFGISPERIVVGSFQKDGVGWGDGMEPKPIKGPDVFVAAVAELARDFPVTAFLTGPARGYVKRELAARGIPFVHTYVEGHTELAECYHALDLYFVTSREEGGPMGLMESMSSGVPVVSTRVGMAPDLVTDGLSGGLVEPEDAAGVAARAAAILALPEADSQALRAAAREAVKAADWPVVGRDHWRKVYQPLIAR